MNRNQTTKFLTVILSVMFSAFLSMTFTACSSDDDDPLTTKQMLEGNWNFNGGDVSFSSNGQFQMNYNQENMSGTWVMDGDEWIIVNLSDKARSTSNILYFQIISLNKDNLSLKIFESRDENGNGVNEILDLTMDKVGGGNSDSSSVVGIWKGIEYTWYPDKECTTETSKGQYNDYERPYYEFMSNGKAKVHWQYGNEIEASQAVSYQYDSNKQTITLGGRETFYIVSLTSSSIELLMLDWEPGEDENYKWVKMKMDKVSAVGK